MTLLYAGHWLSQTFDIKACVCMYVVRITNFTFIHKTPQSTMDKNALSKPMSFSRYVSFITKCTLYIR